MPILAGTGWFVRSNGLVSICFLWFLIEIFWWISRSRASARISKSIPAKSAGKSEDNSEVNEHVNEQNSAGKSRTKRLKIVSHNKKIKPEADAVKKSKMRKAWMNLHGRKWFDKMRKSAKKLESLPFTLLKLNAVNFAESS